MLRAINSAYAQSLQLCPAVCNSIDCRLPCFSDHGILQARILECAAMPSSRGSFQPRDRICISYDSYISGKLWLSHLDAPSLIDSSRLIGELQEFRKHLGTLQQARGHGLVLNLWFLRASVSLSLRGGSRFFPGSHTNVGVSLFPLLLLFASVSSLTHTQPIKHTDEHTEMLTYG